MIADLKPCPRMKDSGIPWLGRIPSTWNVARNGALFAQRNEVGFADLPLFEVSLRTGVRVRNLDGRGRKQMMSDRDKYKRARKGDIAYNMMRMWQGALGRVPFDGLVSPAYVVARPLPGVESGYFEYLFRTDAYMAEVDKYSHGIVKDRNRLYWEEFKQMPSPVPPLEEQDVIVRFLAYVDRRIRRFIRAKEKLIDHLEEQKQAIIHSTVTLGLNPKARLKPSGMEWLGSVPEHWSRIAIRQLAVRGRSTFVNGPFGSDLLTAELTRSGVPVVYIRDISSGVYRRVSAAHVTPGKAAGLEFCRVTAGDVLIAKVGDPPGTATTYPPGQPDAIVTQDVIRIRVDTTRILPEYLVVYLNSRAGRVALGPVVVESTRGRVTLPDFKAVPVLVPPVSEQKLLLCKIARVTVDFVSAASRAHRQISLLREYRTCLIADVITGKLDVRDEAARLPEEIVEAESPDEAESTVGADEDLRDESDEVPEEAEG